MRQKNDLEKLNAMHIESKNMNVRLDKENERIKNKTRLAHQELKKKLDDHLLD